MSDVTVSAKRYAGPWVYVCAGCDLLAESSRSDTLTCSTACRVRAHRNGRLARMRASAVTRDDRTGKPNIALSLQAEALLRLRPDLESDIMAGRLTIAQAQPLVCRAFTERLLTEAREHAISERLHDFTH